MSLNVRTGIAYAMDRLEQELLEIGYTRVADDLPNDDLVSKQYKRHASQRLTEISREENDRETIVWRDAG